MHRHLVRTLRISCCQPLSALPSSSTLRCSLPLNPRRHLDLHRRAMSSSSAPPRQTVEYGKKQVQIFSSSKDLEAALGPYISSMSQHRHSTASAASSTAPLTAGLPLCLCTASSLLAVSANNAFKARGKFTVAFSGGSLPATVGAALNTETERASLAASLPSWHVLFADERLVPLSDSESNYAVVQKHFLAHFPSIPAESVLKLNESLLSSPAEAAADYQRRLLAVVPDRVLDLVLLGVGPDGHTCSLFPSHPLVDEKQLLVASITDSPKPPPQRITFTLPLVNSARHAVFVITGDKADALHGALDQPERRLPSGLVEAENTAFFLDTKAASKLNKAKL